MVGEYDSSGEEIKTYDYKPGSRWTTDPLFMKKGSVYYFYHTDHLGSPQKLTSTNGAVFWNATYISFLKANIHNDSSVTNNFRAGGQYYDTETELHNNYFRYYDPNIGRYLRTDPSHSKQPDYSNIPLLIYDLMLTHSEFNNYSYVNNSSVNQVDPTGLNTIVIPRFFFPRFAIPRLNIPRIPQLDPLPPCPPYFMDNIDMKDTGTWPKPPADGPFTEGDPSRKKPRKRGEKSFYDKEGGEWRPHLKDKYHPQDHWDYKPPGPNSPWQDVPMPSVSPVSPYIA